MNMNVQPTMFSWKEVFIGIYFNLRTKVMSDLGNRSGHMNQ